MKRSPILIVLLGVLALTVFYSPRTNPVPRVRPRAFAATSPPANAERSKPPGIAPPKTIPVVQSAGTTNLLAAKPRKATPAFDNFALWAVQFTNSSANLADGERLAWKRREAMLNLIQTDPAAAIAQTVPFDWRQKLPPEVTRFFEEQLDGRGDFTAAVGTDFVLGNSTVLRNVQLGANKYQAFVYAQRLVQPCSTGIPLHGIALDGKMAVQAEALRVLSADEATALAEQRGTPLDPICGVSGRPATSRNKPVYAESGGALCCFCGDDHYQLVNTQWARAEAGRTAATGDGTTIGDASAVDDQWTHGSKSVLYMRVNFPDDLTEPISEADAYSAMAGVNSYYVANSYGLTSMDPTVTPVVTVPQVKAYYSTDPGLLLTDARAAAFLAGYDTDNYDRDIVAFTSVPGYTFGGLAYVGGKGVWLQSMGSGVTSHELGHNYGVWHANFWNMTNTASATGPGTNLEYGNFYDTMGSANAGIYLFNTAHKKILDWLKSDAMQVVTSNGVYRIYPMDDPRRVDGRSYAAVVKKDFMRDYWLEFRNQFTGNPWLQNGVLLNWAPWAHSNGGTSMIDTTPGSPDFSDASSREDAAVVVGRTFNDNAAGVHITTLARGVTGTDPYLDIQVNLGSFPGNSPPFVNVEVDKTNVAPNTLVTFHATATDLDGDALAYSWNFDDLTFSTNNLPWAARSWSTSGDHVVRCIVSDMKGGEASVNVLVTVGSPGGARISGRILDPSGYPLEGVLVSNGSNTLTGFFGSYTDSDGRYLIPNVGGSLSLSAVQYGYAFEATTNWSNPLPGTADVTNADFIAIPMTMVSIAADTNAVMDNDGTTHYFTVTRTGATNNDLIVQFGLSGSATSGGEYNLSPGITTNYITIPAGSSNVIFSFNAINRPSFPGPETATLTVVDDTNYAAPAYALGTLAEATITILDPYLNAKPAVNVVATTPEISENGMDTGQFVFTRDGAAKNDLMVTYTVGGTGRAGKDYIALAAAVLIPAGQDSAIVSLQPLNDHGINPDETVTVTITGAAGYTVGSAASDTITIINDDAATVTVFPTTEPAAEPSSPGAFTIKRDGDLTAALVVNYNVGGSAIPGTDYVALGGVVTIPAGAATTTVQFTPKDAGRLKTNDVLTLILTNGLNYDIGTPGSATIAIAQAEVPTVTITAPVNTVSEQGTTFGQFLLSRTTTHGDLSVNLNISGTALSGTHYLPLNNPAVIPDGSGSVTLDVIPFQDAVLEAAQTVVATLAPNTNYNVGSPASATVTISDDGISQTPAVGFCLPSSAAVEGESPGIAVCLSITSSVPVSVDYRVVGGTAPASRYSLPPGTLTFSSSNWVAFVPLKIVNDGSIEPPQTVIVALYNSVNAALDGLNVHTYTILDDDAGSISVTATAPNASATGPVPGNFRIKRVGPTTSSQLVNFQITGTASAPTVYTPLGTSATIPAGAAFVDLPVTPTSDPTAQLAQTVVLTLISAPGGAITTPGAATVTIGNNSTNPLPVITVNSTNQPDALEGGGNGAFVFTRTGATTSPLTISYTIAGTAAAGTRYTALPSSVTIPAGQSSASLPVVAIDDRLVEGEQTVILSLTESETYHPVEPSSATVTIQDNDQNVWLNAGDFIAAKYLGDPGQFTFSRFGTTNTPVTVHFTISGTAVNGSDYVRITNTMIIPAGQLTATLPVIPLINGIVKGPVTVTLTLQTDAAYNLATPTIGTVTINDNEPVLSIYTITDNVLEGGGSNGVFRIIRTGDPYIDFTAHLAVSGTATYGVDYPAFPTDIYFSCGVTSVDLYISPTNELVVEGPETVIASLVPNPTYTILSPRTATLTIDDAGTNVTPVVTIVSPVGATAFLVGANTGLVLDANVSDGGLTNTTLAWSEVSGPTNYAFGGTNTANTTIFFTNAGIYVLRLTADTGQLQGHADVTAIVVPEQLTGSTALHWKFDEGSGTNVLDALTNGRNGLLTGNPTWITNGVLGGALNFPGAGDSVRGTNSTNFMDGLREFTLSLWLKPATTNLDGGFFTSDDSGTNQALELSARNLASCGKNTNVIEVTLPTIEGVVHHISGSGAVNPFQWQHVALTWSNGLAPSFFINGQLDRPADGMVTLGGVLTNCPKFIIGKGSPASPGSWNGAVDDVRFFPRALSANEILALDGWGQSNHAPAVVASSNVTVQLGVPLTISGSETDDGLPVPPGLVTTEWSNYGTNFISIPDPLSETNTFVFLTPGDYEFQFTADDGQAATFALVDVTAIEPTAVYIYADIPDAYELGPIPGDFTLVRDGATNELTVYLTFSGTASNGVDYVTVTNVVTFAPGSDTTNFQVMPYLTYAIKGDESVIATIITNIAYSITTGTATVTIHDSLYGQWSIQNFTLEQLTHPEQSGPGADFDSDTIPNFAEYAFNLNPKVPDHNPPYTADLEIDPDDGLRHFTFTYTRRLPPRDVEYGIFISTNLVNWNTGTNYIQEFYNVPDTNNITETVKARAIIPYPDTARMYMYMSVWLQQVPVDP